MINMDPLFEEGWIKFNEHKWGVKASVIELSPTNIWNLKTVIYLNKHGKIVLPPRNPYLPIYFECEAQNLPKVNARKREAFSALADIYDKKGVHGTVTFSPNIMDMRSFTWKNFIVTPIYTYHIDIETFSENARNSVINKAKKAIMNGYHCEISKDYAAIEKCLSFAENRKSFKHRTTKEDLAYLANTLGDENFICFLAKDKDGNPVGTWIRLFEKNGGIVHAWSASVENNALRDGVNSLLGQVAFEYFEQVKCRIFDFGGANLPSVASMKENWGGELVTYYTIRERNFRNLIKEIYYHAKQVFG